MRRFQFGLQRVLDVRRQRERQVQVELAALESTRRREADRLAALVGERRDIQADLKSRIEHSAEPTHVVSAYQYLERLGARIQQQQRKLSEAESHVEEKRVVLVFAARERRVLERLREIRLDQHREECLKDDAKEVDETATLRHDRERTACSPEEVNV